MRQSLPIKLLIALCNLHLLVNCFWLFRNEAPLPWDQAGHTRIALDFAKHFTGNRDVATPFLNISRYYPPLAHIAAASFLIIFGFSVQSVGLFSTTIFILLLIGIFILTNELIDDEWVSLITTLIFSLLPPIFASSRWFLLDIPQLALLVYAWYFLAKSQYFSHVRYTVLFALFSAMVLLTKWTGVIFILIPSLMAFYKRWKLQFTPKIASYLYLCFIFSLMIVFPWYFSNLERLTEMGSIAVRGESSDPQRLFSIQNLTFYLGQMINFQFTLWPAIAAILSAVYYFAKPNKHRWLIGSYLLSLYGIFTVINNKDIRYTFPLLLPISYMFAHCFVSFVRQKIYLGSVFLGTSILWLIAQYFILSFHLLPTYQQAINLGPLGWIDYVNTGDIVVSYPKPDTTPNKKVIDLILALQSGKKATVFVGIDQPNINLSTLELMLDFQNNQTLRIEAPFERVSFEKEKVLTDYLNQFDYLLIPNKSVGVDATRHKKALEQIQQYVLITRPDLFVVLQSYETNTDAGNLLVIKRK